jgi:MFS family permease
MKDTFAPLRHPPFRFLAAGRTITMFGNAMAPLALAFAVLDLTGSATDLGLVVGARSVVNVLFLLFGGVVADRLPRQQVMVVSSALSFLTQATVATLVLTHRATIPALIALSAINGLTAAFAFPASSAILAQTIPADVIKQANAINRLGINIASIGGAALGGVIVATFGPGWGVAVDAAAFALAGCLFALVRVPAYREAGAEHTSTLHELREGWKEVISRTWFWVVVLGFMFSNMSGNAVTSVLGPALADASFGRQNWGFIVAVFLVGMVVGAFVAIRLRARRLLLVGVIGLIGTVPLEVALGLGTSLAIVFPLAFIAGVGMEQNGIAWETSVQEHVPQAKLARVYSYDALGSFVAIPIGQVAAGPLAEAVGISGALFITAAVDLLAVVGMLSSRSVRTLTHQPASAPDQLPVTDAGTVPVSLD